MKNSNEFIELRDRTWASTPAEAAPRAALGPQRTSPDIAITRCRKEKLGHVEPSVIVS